MEASAFDLINAELERQLGIWGVQNHHPYKWNSILGEEFGEACKASLDDDPNEYITELVQVAAVAIAAIESVRRNR